MSFQNNYIEFSQTETETLGLKIGRCNKGYFDEYLLQKEIFFEKYDLCRVKVPAEDEFVASRLDKIGLPYYFSGSIRKYKTPINKEHRMDLIHPEIEFIDYDTPWDELLLTLLKDTWGENPIGYYRTPIVNSFCNKEKEIMSVFNFYKKFNNVKNFSNNTIKLMKYKENFVGFFALNIVGQHLESHIGGILKPYQSEGFFYDMLAYIKNFCLDKGLSHFVFGARNENAQVQKIFHNAGFIPIGTDNVFHIVSLISKITSTVNLDSHKEMYDIQNVGTLKLFISKILEYREEDMEIYMLSLKSADGKNLTKIYKVENKNKEVVKLIYRLE